MASVRTDLTVDGAFSRNHHLIVDMRDAIERLERENAILHEHSDNFADVLTGDSEDRYYKKMCQGGVYCYCCGRDLRKKPYKILLDKTEQLCDDCYMRYDNNCKQDLFGREEIANASFRSDGEIII